MRRFADAGATGSTDIAGGFSDLEYSAHNQTLRYDGVFGSRWLLEANIANSSQKFNEVTTTDEWIYSDLRFTPQGTTGGLGFHESNDGKNLQYGLKSTHILSGGGTH